MEDLPADAAEEVVALQHRVGVPPPPRLITATEVAAVLNLDPFCSRFHIYRKKAEPRKGLRPAPPTEAMIWGRRYEPRALEMYAASRGAHLLHPGMVVHETVPYLGGIPDAVTSDGTLVEVKCPMRRRILAEVPPYYVPQLQVLMEILGLERAHFVQFHPDSPGLTVVEVPRDRAWFERSLPVLQRFWDDATGNKMFV